MQGRKRNLPAPTDGGQKTEETDLRIFTTVLTANGTLGWVWFAIAALLCVLASETVCIVFLTRRILTAKKAKQEENEPRGTSLSGFAPLFLAAGGVTRPVEVLLAVFCALALLGAVSLFILFVICYRKGYIFPLRAPKQAEAQDPLTDLESPASEELPADDADRAIAAFAQTEKQAEAGEQIAVSFFSEDDESDDPSVFGEAVASSDDDDSADLSDDEGEDDEDNDDDESDGENVSDRFTGNERIIGMDEETGCYIVARYRKSFEAKLSQAQPQIKKYYSGLKNALLSYKGTKSRMSWTADSFHNGRAQLAKINVKTRILELYLAIDPATLEGSVYRGQDVGALKKYEETPFRYKIRTPRKFNWALELVHRVSEEHGLTPIEIQPVNYAKQYPFDTIDNLVSRKLIKVTTRLEKPATTFELDEEIPTEEEDITVPTDFQPHSWAYEGDQPVVETEQISADVVIPQPTEQSDETVRITQINYTEAEGENGEPVTVTERVITDAPIHAVVDEEPTAAAMAELSEEADPLASVFGEAHPEAIRSEETDGQANDLTADDFADVTFAKDEQAESPAVETLAKEEPTYADPHYEDVKAEDLQAEKPIEPQWSHIPPREEQPREEQPFGARSYEPAPEETPSPAPTASPRPREENRADSALAVVDVALLDINFEDGDVVTLEVLRRHGLVAPTATRLKVRASGKMRHALTVVANQFTYDAILVIGEAGGEAQFIR